MIQASFQLSQVVIPLFLRTISLLLIPKRQNSIAVLIDQCVTVIEKNQRLGARPGTPLYLSSLSVLKVT